MWTFTCRSLLLEDVDITDIIINIIGFIWNYILFEFAIQIREHPLGRSMAKFLWKYTIFCTFFQGDLLCNQEYKLRHIIMEYCVLWVDKYLINQYWGFFIFHEDVIIHAEGRGFEIFTIWTKRKIMTPWYCTFVDNRNA